jgi:hypothetical protein
MPQFNPELPGTDKEKGYTGYSEGIRPQREIEGPPSKQFAKEADKSAYYKAQAKTAGTDQYGNILKGAIEFADYGVQTYIGDELRSQKEAVDAEFGVREAATTEANSIQPVPPAELEMAFTQVEGVQAGYQAGRLKESHYWARLESITRQMKSRFPGYKDQIDQRIGSLAGRTPANALRDELRQEALAADKVKDRRVQIVERAVFDGSLYQAYGPEGPPEGTSTEQILKDINVIKGQSAVVAAETAKLALDDKRKDLNKDEAMDVGKRHSMLLWSREFKATTHAAGGLDPFIKAINTAQADLNSGGIIDENEQQDLLVKLNTWTRQKEASFENWANSPVSDDHPDVTWRSLINDEEKMKQLKQPFMDSVAQYREAVINKDYGFIGLNAKYIQASETSVGARLLKTSDSARLYAGIKGVMGETGASLILTKDNGLLDSLNSSINDQLAKKSMLGETASIKAVFDEWRAQGVDNPAAYNAAIVNHVAMLVENKDLPKENFNNLVDAMYGSENLNMLSKWSEKQKLSAFRTFTSPEVQAKMEEIKGSNPQAWAKYRSWVSHNFNALFRTDLMNASEALGVNNYATLTWDEKNMQFIPQELKKPDMSRALDSYYANQYQRLDSTVKRINEELKGIGPILASDQDDPGAYLGDLVTKMGLDPHLIKTGSLTATLLDAVYKGVRSDTLSSEPDSKAPGGVPPEVPPIALDLQGLDEAAVAEVSAMIANIKAKAAASAAERKRKQEAGEIN